MKAMNKVNGWKHVFLLLTLVSEERMLDDTT